MQRIQETVTKFRCRPNSLNSIRCCAYTITRKTITQFQYYGILNFGVLIIEDATKDLNEERGQHSHQLA